MLNLKRTYGGERLFKTGQVKHNNCLKEGQDVNSSKHSGYSQTTEEAPRKNEKINK